MSWLWGLRESGTSEEKSRVREGGETDESIHGGMTVIWINIMITTSNNSKTGPYLCCQER